MLACSSMCVVAGCGSMACDDCARRTLLDGSEGTPDHTPGIVNRDSTAPSGCARRIILGIIS